ncbi:hypothetical protein Daura_21170 [Dactylosporangium aurantiacum]|uniref:PLL-like beta propeller domain-containing protein n=1 Tax=Dactylosporangium aurantiacum TaxID=35754 RepID=A0A9Q9ML01_9ACTN|nr:hypothetical protein [Dactylosporangium aurantiacum]MDG6109136.1 hypothetical protein [Dactylosporangium aurantiacum]UWZ58465.1 hypothetical protein Daura_21170 [Dactylosporangium aurantiacum]
MTSGTPTRRQILKGGLFAAGAGLLAPLVDAAPALAYSADSVASRVFEFNGQLHFVDRSANSALEHHWQNQGSSTFEYRLHANRSAGGRVVGLRWAAVNQAHAFARDDYGNVTHWWQDPGSPTWNDETPTGLILGDPTAAVFQDTLYLLARDQGNFLSVNTQTPGGSWTASSRISETNGWLTGSPVAVVFNGQLHVFGVGWDNTVFHAWRGGTGGWGCDRIDSVTLFRPAVVAAHNQLHVFIRNNQGELEHRWQNAGGGGWGKDTLYGSTIIGGPTATVLNGVIYVFARSYSGNDLLQWSDNVGWTIMTNRHGYLVDEPTAATVFNQLQIFGKGGPWGSIHATLEHYWDLGGNKWEPSAL